MEVESAPPTLATVLAAIEQLTTRVRTVETRIEQTIQEVNATKEQPNTRMEQIYAALEHITTVQAQFQTQLNVIMERMPKESPPHQPVTPTTHATTP